MTEKVAVIGPVTDRDLAQAALVYARLLHADLERAHAGDFGALLTAGTVAAHLSAITPHALMAAAWRKACQEPPGGA